MLNSSWSNKYDNLTLKNNQIHIWLLDIYKIAKTENDFNEILSNDELEKKSKFHFEKDRIVYGTTRGILRKILSHYLDVLANEIIFKYNKYGKPFINKCEIQFNASHSNKLGILAFCLHDEIGIDIEYVNKEYVKEEIADKYFSDYERQCFSELSEKERATIFFDIWTRKEAYIKAYGKGLSIPLDSFDVSLNKNNPQILRSIIDANNSCNLYNIEVKEDYSCSLANLGKRKEIIKYTVKSLGDSKNLFQNKT